MLAGREGDRGAKFLVGPVRSLYPGARPVQLRLRRQYRLIALVTGNSWTFAWAGSHEEANRVTRKGWPG